jgi:predicted MFS family arabinose efflux permease
MPSPTAALPSERSVILLLGAVQAVNILDFMMVMPLGPDFSTALGFGNDRIGVVAGAYTGAAAISGLAGATFLDRFDRRQALAVAMAGLVVATFAGGFATSLNTMVLARATAGLFGGPATSLTYAIVADIFPPERRGRAVGALMGAFSVASVIGVPAALELSALASWRAPFVVVGLLGLAVSAGAVFLLPPMRGHLDRERRNDSSVLEILKRPVVQLSWTATALVFMSSFVLIPNLAAYIQENMDYPRERLGLLYGVGGAVSFFTMRMAGALVDRFGSTRVATAGALLYVCVVWAGFLHARPETPVLAVFVAFMISMNLRNVSFNTLTTKVPLPTERARFGSIQSAVQHFAAAAAAALSSQLLTERADKSLDGMERVVTVSIALTLLVPPALFAVERLVLRQEAQRVSAPVS